MKAYIVLLLLLFLVVSCAPNTNQENNSMENNTVPAVNNTPAEDTNTLPESPGTNFDAHNNTPIGVGEYKLTLTAVKNKDNSVTLTWNRFDGDMKFYKIVRSTTDATPTYYEDGFIETIWNENITTYTDKAPKAGLSYYAVTIVQPLNRYIDSNPVTIEFPDPSETPDQEITLTAEAVANGGVKVSWTRYDGDFYQYKLVRAAQNPFPKYPDDVLVKTIPFVEETSYVDYRAQKGDNYYAVTIIRPDKSKFTSSPVKITLA